MKKVLSLLLVFVFLKAQALALSGGPVFSNSQGNFVGIYSGVLVPKFTTFTSTSTASGSASTSIGLFNLSQPDTGLATGTVLMFVDGAPFSGILTGIIDPDSAELNAVIDATSTFQVTIIVPVVTVVNGVPTTTFTTQNFSVSASGNMNAKVIPTGFFSTANVAVTPSRLEGDASVDIYFQINNDGTPDVSKTAVFEVQGFKQSDTAGTTGTGGITIGTGAGGTGA
jgi:hypothetical protein